MTHLSAAQLPDDIATLSSMYPCRREAPCASVRHGVCTGNGRLKPMSLRSRIPGGSNAHSDHGLLFLRAGALGLSEASSTRDRSHDINEPPPVSAPVGSRGPADPVHLSTPFDETTWPTAKTVLARALTMRRRLSREGWWN